MINEEEYIRILKTKSKRDPQLKNDRKILKGRFPKFEKKYLKLLFEYCDHELQLTLAILQNNHQTRVEQLIEEVVLSTEGHAMLNKKINYLIHELTPKKFIEDEIQKSKLSGDKPEALKEQMISSEFPIPQNSFILKWHHDFLIRIFDFLDPMSLGRARMTCKEFDKVAIRPNFYKKFCLALYSKEPNLPFPSVFEELSARVQSSTLLFTFETRIAAFINARNVVWNEKEFDVKTFSNKKAFFKSFMDWRQMFLKAPRLNFKGVYVMKERYLKVGQKDNNQSYDPVYPVEFYRYLRFFPNGSLLSGISLKKVKEEEICDKFKWRSSQWALVNDPQAPELFMDEPVEEEEQKYEGGNNYSDKNINVMKGEYIVQEDKLFLRTFRGFTVYEFNLKIRSTDIGTNDLLIVLSRFSRDVGKCHRDDMNKDHLDQLKLYRFRSIKGFENDLKRFPKANCCL